MRPVILSTALLVTFSVTAFVYAADIDTGLLAYWPLDDDANDVVSRNNGKPLGGASFVDDPARGMTLEVDGKDGRIEAPNADNIIFGNTDSHTLYAWVNMLTLLGHWGGIVHTSESPWYGIWVDNRDRWVAAGRAPNPMSDIIGSEAQADGWHHVALVQDSAANTRTLYVDGNVDATGNAIIATGGGDLCIGGLMSYNELIHARIDDVILYSRALSADDVQLLMAGPPTSVKPVDKLPTTWSQVKQ